MPRMITYVFNELPAQIYLLKFLYTEEHVLGDQPYLYAKEIGLGLSGC